jgi:broad specificity phosphatase PhoE
MKKILAIRHGQSEANQQNLIIATALNGVNGFGLCDKGRSQALEVSKFIGNQLIC